MALASIRPPAVAGQFYPGDERVLRTQLAEMLSTAVALEAAPTPKAIIVPHAGYMYSGPVAASASMYQNVQMVKLVSGSPKSSGAT